MKRKKFKLYSFVFMITMGFFIGFSIIREEPIIAIAAIVIGMILLFALRSRLKEVMEDERIYKISEKASRRTIQLVSTSFAIIGLSIIGLSKSRYLELAVADIGYSLASTAAVLLIVYMIFYWYYAKKLGE